jgi:hypothetical protein
MANNTNSPLDQVNADLEQLKTYIKDTISLYYDDIEVKKFVEYDYKENYLVGEFIAADERSLLFQINREGVPDLIEKINAKRK